MKQRNPFIDFYRCFGLLLIILAHIGVPYTLLQIRCFDVPLMVFISGLTMADRTIPNLKEYYVHRTLRLVVPVWCFMIFYVLLMYCLERLGIVEPGYVTLKDTISAFLLLKGYGYVWIIRVFLLIMLATPLLLKLADRIHSLKSLLLCAILFLLGQALLCSIKWDGLTYFIFDKYFLYLTGYSILFVFGVKVSKLKISEYGGKRLAIIIGGALLLSLIYYGVKDGIPVGISSIYKYPPQYIYIVYGLGMSTLLWLIRDVFKPLVNIEIFQFIGKNTIWIYLWHIPMVMLAMNVIPFWPLRYIFVVFFSIAIYYLQYLIIQKINSKPLKNYLIG